MNGSVQMELITPNGGMMRHSYGIDNTGYTLHEQDVDSDSWEDSADDESVIERNKEINEGIRGIKETSEGVLVKDVLLVMGEGDPRFGFSFIGGVDEGLPPTVDEMLPGSPADRADLEVGDEIFEVNGNSLQDASHTEVISHIQQCVKSRTICLRVKRKVMKDSDPEKHRLKQAYVVAVEQQTKDKLNEIAARNNVESIDFTALQSANQKHIPEINGHIEKEQVETEQGEPAKLASSPQSEATVEIGHNSEINGSLGEPLIEPSQINRDSTVIDKERWNQLFQEDTYKDNASSPDPIDIGDLYASLRITDPEALSVHSNLSNEDTSELVREPSIKQNVKTVTTLPLDFSNLLEKSPPTDPSPQHSESMTSNNGNMAAAPPEKKSSRKPPREVAVDCPPNFVAASGMKNPPAPYHGVNGQATMTNGPTMVNGIDSIPNNHTNGDAKKVSRPKEDNTFKVNNLDKNSSHSNIPDTTLLQPVSNKPLFEQKPISAQDYTNNNKPVDIQELFSCLNEIQSKLDDNKGREDVQFLKQLFHNSDFQQALSLHNQVAQVHQRDPLPLPEATNAELLAAEIALSTRDVRSKETDALRRIFADPHTKALLRAHDQIATRDPVQQLPYSEVRNEEPEQPAAKPIGQPTDGPDRIIRIEKSNNPLGATIVNDNEEVLVGRIIKGGMAERTGLLHEGDRILEINGMDVTGKSIDEISDMLVDVDGTITFRVIPAREVEPPQQSQSARNMIHVKALFKYDPEDDAYIPCRELGLSFEKGDILHIINQEDANWWQAYRDGEDEQALAGLIPSKSFQRNREQMKKKLPDDEEPKKGCRCSKKKKKKKKGLYDADSEENEADELILYEEVGIYYANPQAKRPIVLVGPPSVGINELKRKLLEDDTKYKAAVPHTSRSRKNHEIDGMDYHFTTKHQFEQDIAAGKFVEYGEFGKNLYGISLESISSVVAEGRICVLNLHPQGVDRKEGMMGQGPLLRFLKRVKNSNLHPYFIFIAPPSLDRLRQQRIDAGEHLKEEELRNIIEMGRSMEDIFGHYFDCVIIHYDHDRAYRDLTNEIERIQTEPQWVPIQWIRS